MASRALLCLSLLLLVSAATFAGASIASSEAEAPTHGGGGGAVAAGCWRSVMEMPEPCARDVLRTLILGTVHIGKDCCEVLGRVGEKCVVEVFSSLPLGDAYLPVVNRICGLVSSVA